MTAVEEDRLTDEQLEQIRAMREAQENEGETSDETETDEAETADGSEDEPEAAAPAPTVDIAEREKKLRSEDTRHENALKKIHGDDFAEHAFCPLCLGQGFLTPMGAGDMPDEIWEAVKALAGKMEGGEYEHPVELVQCERCNGYGQVATGAKNEHNAVIPCEPCQSRGYFNLKDPVHRGRLGLAPEQAQAAPPPAVFPTFNLPQPPQPAGEQPPVGWVDSGKPNADTWGRWPGHARYGNDPSFNGGQW